MLKLFNYLARKKEIFKPFRKGRVGLYTCGPTVYDYAHIGNLRTYIFEDILRRVLEFKKFRVKHVMNITDVGHLTSDEDEGEDKLEIGAKREKKSPRDIAKFYTRAFLNDIKRLNIAQAHVFTPATAHVGAQIRIIKELFKKGFAYETSQAVYFHVPKFKGYTRLSRQPLAKKAIGARKEVIVDPEKRHPADFALWFKLIGRFKNHIMQWPSPWGRGFPGWHIECSAISSKFLGQPFDIHTGGIDHLPVHHTNEIAQSEAAYGKPLAKFWLEGEHMLVEGKKMSKSLGNFYTLRDLETRGFSTLDFRYFAFGAHYRKPLNFTWNALKAAKNARAGIMAAVSEIKSSRGKATLKEENEALKVVAYLEKRFLEALNDDLNAPKALAVLNELLHYSRSLAAEGGLNSRSRQMVLALAREFDRVLGLDLLKIERVAIPSSVHELLREREEFRKRKQWQEADRVREEIAKQGYKVEDTASGPRLSRLN